MVYMLPRHYSDEVLTVRKYLCYREVDASQQTCPPIVQIFDLVNNICMKIFNLY
jgi:hypothetical protein